MCARRRLWTLPLALLVTGLITTPLVLGAALGYYQLNPVALELHSEVGEFSHLLLQRFPDQTLVVDIAYQQPASPPPIQAVALLLSRINETCDKAKVTVLEHPFTSSLTRFDDASLVNLAATERSAWPSLTQMSILFLVLNGSYAPSVSTLGLAFRGSSAAIFEARIAALAPKPEYVTNMTASVMIHEFGHEIGLVGIVGPAPNEDPTHPEHSSNPNDVMYYGIDTIALAVFGGTPPTQFDPQDMKDLDTVRATVILSEVIPWVILAIDLASIYLAIFFRARTIGRKPGLE